MKIALFGASGSIGRQLAREALVRHHQVTAIVRDPRGVELPTERLSLVTGDASDPDKVAAAVEGHDAAISAVGPRPSDPPDALSRVAKALLAGCARARVKRLLVVGGTGSLEAAPGVLLLDTPQFPTAWKGIARAHLAALELIRASDLDWTVLSPAAVVEPGERTGRFRTGKDQLLSDAKGESRISIEDYAIALLDELEHPRHVRERFTVGY